MLVLPTPMVCENFKEFEILFKILTFSILNHNCLKPKTYDYDKFNFVTTEGGGE